MQAGIPCKTERTGQLRLSRGYAVLAMHRTQIQMTTKHTDWKLLELKRMHPEAAEVGCNYCLLVRRELTSTEPQPRCQVVSTRAFLRSCINDLDVGYVICHTATGSSPCLVTALQSHAAASQTLNRLLNGSLHGCRSLQ